MNKISMLLLGSLALVATSCLKDEEIDDQKYGMKGIEDIKLVEFPNSPRTTATLDFSTRDTTFDLVTVRLNEAQPAAQDITVTLQPNDSLVTAAGYNVPATSAYAFDNLSVTIPRGSREGHLKITTQTANLSDKTYAFGFTIGAVSDPAYNVSANYNKILAVLPVKNKYDGRYKVEGTMLDRTTASLTGLYPFEVELRTVDANTAIMYNVSVTSFAGLHPILSGASTSAYGGFRPVLKFDAAGNVVEVTNDGVFGQPNPANQRGGALDPTGVNKYDESTQTLEVSYFMTQPHPAVRTEFKEKLTFMRKR